jgi:hypothetical protein
MMILDTLASSFLFHKGNYLQGDCPIRATSFFWLFLTRSGGVHGTAHFHIHEHPFPGLVDA